VVVVLGLMYECIVVCMYNDFLHMDVLVTSGMCLRDLYNVTRCCHNLFLLFTLLTLSIRVVLSTASCNLPCIDGSRVSPYAIQ
jgi:hypothetical protein